MKSVAKKLIFIGLLSVQFFGLNAEQDPMGQENRAMKQAPMIKASGGVTVLDTLEDAQKAISQSTCLVAITVVRLEGQNPCPYCLQFDPIYRAASTDARNAKNVGFYYVNQRSLQFDLVKFSQAYRLSPIQHVPTILFFKNGEIVYQHIGALLRPGRFQEIIDLQLGQ